ncbi:MAG: hypothetical protein A2177_10905 [Spirochaetes bacterium RBG_13_68_11]|nr:MAG: hypothetical protein A2177_10905 [Spirochaetes bacterium RBG_13_68_11]
MKRLAAFSLLLLLALVLLSCGGDGLSLFPRSEASDLSITGPEDGSVYTSTQPLALQIGTSDPAGHPNLEVQVTLFSATGDSVWEQRLTGPAPNEDLGLQLPELPAGRYELEIVVRQNGEQVERHTATIFSVRDRPRISGIASFPPLITASTPVQLSADITADAGSDPWLRWTWRGKTIAQGSRSSGAAAVLWKAPADDGVYAVTLELFPVAPPEGTGYSFRSSIAMSTDIYVSAAGAAARNELGPVSSYLSLFHLQADLADAVAVAKDPKRVAIPIGSPRIVPVGDGFGYRLEGGAGFRVPWPVLPVDMGELAPFTLSVGIRPEQLTGADRIVTATAGAITFTLEFGTDASPELAVAVPDSPRLVIPSGAPSLVPGQRCLVSVSVEPRLGGLSVRWFNDGRQISETTVSLLLPPLGADGSAIVGGGPGFVAVIDELGVYYRDEAGRPATDPTLFRAAMRRLHGDRLLFADGFDGMFLPAEFSMKGKSDLLAGAAELQPNASLELPPVQFPAKDFSIELGLDQVSEQSAIVRLSWAVPSSPFTEARLAADSGILRLQFLGETVTDGVRSSMDVPPAPAEKAGLIVRVTCPPEAKTPLAIDRVLALTANGKK